MNHSKTYTNAAEACDDLANQHFNLAPWRKRIFLYVWNSERVRWLVLVALAIIGTATAILT